MFWDAQGGQRAVEAVQEYERSGHGYVRQAHQVCCGLDQRCLLSACARRLHTCTHTGLRTLHLASQLALCILVQTGKPRTHRWSLQAPMPCQRPQEASSLAGNGKVRPCETLCLRHRSAYTDCASSVHLLQHHCMRAFLKEPLVGAACIYRMLAARRPRSCSASTPGFQSRRFAATRPAP